MVNHNYRKGYSAERHACLTLEYNDMHVKRNSLSIGIEDVIAFDKDKTLLVQCKNTKRGEKSMSKDEISILKKHAKELGAVPVYMFKDSNHKYIWIDVRTGFDIDYLKEFTKEWYRDRMKMRNQLREMKKKDKVKYQKYVLKNWTVVSRYIC